MKLNVFFCLTFLLLVGICCSDAKEGQDVSNNMNPEEDAPVSEAKDESKLNFKAQRNMDKVSMDQEAKKIDERIEKKSDSLEDEDVPKSETEATDEPIAYNAGNFAIDPTDDQLMESPDDYPSSATKPYTGDPVEESSSDYPTDESDSTEDYEPTDVDVTEEYPTDVIDSTEELPTKEMETLEEYTTDSPSGSGEEFDNDETEDSPTEETDEYFPPSQDYEPANNEPPGDDSSHILVGKRDESAEKDEDDDKNIMANPGLEDDPDTFNYDFDDQQDENKH